MRKYLKIAAYLMFWLIMLTGMFYLSLALDVYLQIRSVDRVAQQFVKFAFQESDLYVYKKDIHFTPERVTFQSNSARIYLYINESKFVRADLNNLYLEVIRESYGDIQKSKFYFTEFEKGADYFHLEGYHCFVLPPVRVYPDYNELKFIVGGVTLSAPEHDLKIMLFFNGLKRRVAFFTYLLKAFFAFGSCVLMFAAYYGFVRKNNIQSFLKKAFTSNI